MTAATASQESPSAEDAANDAALTQAFAEYDAELKPITALPAWLAEKNLQATVSAADQAAIVKLVSCAENFCRVDLARQHGESQNDFASRVASLGGNGISVMYRYPDDSKQLMVYLMNTGPALKGYEKRLQ